MRTSFPRNRSTSVGRIPALKRTAGLLISAAITTATLLPTSAARADGPSPTVRWKIAGGQSADDATVSGRVTLRAEVTVDRPVDGWSVTVVTRAEQSPFGVICQETLKRPRQEFDVECRWDTTRYPDGRPSSNGRYLVRLATHHGGTVHPAVPDRAVAVNNRPSPPAAVVMTYDESGTATLTWAANPEPDITHYDVEQKTAGAEWTRIGEPTSTRFELAGSAPADARYRVAAERRNADGLADGPGPWTHAAKPRPTGGGGAAPKRPENAESAKPAQRPVREAPSERPVARSSEAGTSQTPRTGATDHAPEPPEGHGTSAGRPGEQPSPSDRVALAFPAHSTKALASVHEAPAPRHAVATPEVTAPSAREQRAVTPPVTANAQRDTGFKQGLPYPPPPEPAPLPSAVEGLAVPGTTVAATPPGGRTRLPLRLAGIGLVVAGLGLFALVIRSGNRPTCRRPTATEEPHILHPFGRFPPEEPPWLTRLEHCVTRLEASVAEQQRGTRPRGDAADAA